LCTSWTVPPVLVVRARPQDPSVKPWDPLGTPTWPDLAQEFRFGRDLQLLDSAYRVERIQPVDMFPHTHHIENVVQLKLR
jgi:hypothetical protein